MVLLKPWTPNSPGVLAQAQGLGHTHPDVEDEGNEVDEHDGAPKPVDFDALAVLVGLLLLCRRSGHRHFRRDCCSATAQGGCCADQVRVAGVLLLLAVRTSVAEHQLCRSAGGAAAAAAALVLPCSALRHLDYVRLHRLSTDPNHRRPIMRPQTAFGV